MKTEGFSSTLAIRDNQKGALCIVYDNKGTHTDVCISKGTMNGAYIHQGYRY